MALDVGRLGSREILKLQVFDYVSATPIMYFDYANTSTFETGSTRVFAWGAGQRRIAWDGEKTYTLTVESQLFSFEHLAMVAGEEIVKGAKDIYRVDTVLVESGMEINLSKEPIGDVAVFPFVNGVIDKNSSQEVDTVSGSTVTLGGGATVSVGDEVQVFYQFLSTNTQSISFTAKGFPKYVKLIGDTLYVDEVAGEALAAQMVYYKCKLMPNISIASSSQGDPSSITWTFDLFPVFVNGEEVLADMIVYED